MTMLKDQIKVTLILVFFMFNGNLLMSKSQFSNNKFNLVIVITVIVLSTFFAIIFNLKADDHMTHQVKKSNIACSIKFNSPQKLSNEITLSFSVTNPMNEEISLLTWYTPFEGFLSNLFIITNTETGETLKYQGPMVKRLAPETEDYVTLSANQTITTTINLAQGYQLTKGHFSLQLIPTTIKLNLQDNQRKSFYCSPEIITFEIQ